MSVFLGDAGWVDLDPTNDQVPADRHVLLAWGRDYGDVSPLQGVIVAPKDTRAMRRFYRDQFPRPDIPTTYAATGGNRNWSVRVDQEC